MPADVIPHVERVFHALAALFGRPDLSCVDEMIRTQKGSGPDVSQSAPVVSGYDCETMSFATYADSVLFLV